MPGIFSLIFFQNAVDPNTRCDEEAYCSPTIPPLIFSLQVESWFSV